ncbi:MAG: inositol 2-dehydrogenase [Balneolales bacterium]
MNKKINVGIIGLGRLGSTYSNYFAHRIPNANLLAISDVREATLNDVAANYDIKKSYLDYHDLIADKEIDAVIITTPTNTHLEVVLECAKNNKAVFCEKPLSISLNEALLMQEAVESSGIFFHMGFMRRFDSGYAAAKKKIEEGIIGKPVVFKSTSRDPYRPSLEYAKGSGGLVADMGIHDFDLARWYMGDVKSVFSTGGVLAYPEMKKINDIDNAIINLNFDSDALGVIDLSRNGIYGYDIRTEILGTKGTLQIGYLRETPIRVMLKDGITHDAVPYFMERFENAYITQLQNFINNIIDGNEPSIKVADGVATLFISISANNSFKKNKPMEIAAAKSSVGA